MKKSSGRAETLRGKREPGCRRAERSSTGLGTNLQQGLVRHEGKELLRSQVMEHLRKPHKII